MQCPSVLYIGRSEKKDCVLSKGHGGDHRDSTTRHYYSWGEGLRKEEEKCRATFALTKEQILNDDKVISRHWCNRKAHGNDGNHKGSVCIIEVQESGMSQSTSALDNKIWKSYQ